MRGPFTRWPRAADAVLAIFVFLVALLVKSEGPNDDFAIRSLNEVSIAGLFVLAVASGVLYWRRSRPLVALGVTLSASALAAALASLGSVGAQSWSWSESRRWWRCTASAATPPTIGGVRSDWVAGSP